MIMFLMREVKVYTVEVCLLGPVHMLSCTKLPFFLPVVLLTMRMSMGMWLRSLVMDPLGPVTVTFLALTATLTVFGVRA